MPKHRPDKIFFTKDKIKPYFSNGKDINSEIARFDEMWWRDRVEAINKYLPLKVGKCRYDGKYYCNNNRRLYMFRVLQRLGYVNMVETVKVEMRTKSSPEGGCHISMKKGGRPLPHCKCQDNCILL